MPRLVTRAELARIVGTSAMSVTRACRTRLAEACIGPRLDLDHPAAAAYLAEKRGGPTAAPDPDLRPAPNPMPPSSPPAPPSAAERLGLHAWPAPPSPSPPQPPVFPNAWDRVDVEQYADWTLRQISDQFGTVTAFKDWLDARKKQVAIREKELRNAEVEGTLIARDAVRTHVFGHIDGVNRRLLQDVPKTIARRVYALARSDTPVEDAERLVREILSAELRPVKEQVARTLRDAS